MRGAAGPQFRDSKRGKAERWGGNGDTETKGERFRWEREGIREMERDEDIER